MREGWKTVKIKRIANINQENIKNIYPFEKIVYLDISSVGSGEANFENVLKIEEAPSRAKRIAKKFDTIISTVRPGNKTYYYLNNFPENTVISTGFAVVSAIDNKVDNRFLYYALTNDAYIDYLVSVEKGANYPAISPNDILDSEILLPPLKTQRKIASILSAYDDLIENNLKCIKLLEEQAQQTYEEWFVRFKFPGSENAEFDAVSGLPVGWEERDLGDVIVNFDSKRIPVSRMEREKMPGKFPYYGAASIMDYVGDYIFDGRYVLMGEDGTVITNEGYPKLQFVEGKIWVNNHAHVLEGTKISNELLYLFLNQYPIQGHVTGVAQPKINQRNLNRIKVIYASKEVRFAFDKIVKPLFDLNFNLQNQNQLLKEARDILLPRLMMGVIDVDSLEVNEGLDSDSYRMVAEEQEDYKIKR